MQRRFSQFDWGYVTAAVLPIIGFLPFLRDGIISTADGTVHVYRMFAVQQLVQQGDLWPRWIPYFHLGYGYPMFNFYPLGVYHLAVVLGLFGITMPIAYNLIAALAWVIGSVGMYALGRQLFPARIAMLCVFLWTFAPMRMYEVWHQGSLPTIMATGFVPWVFWGLIKVIRNPNPRTMLAFAWPFAAMVMSHPPVTYMTGVFLLPAVTILTLWALRTSRQLFLRRAIFVVGGLTIAVALTAIFLLPLFAELKYIVSSGTQSDVVPYLRSQFLQPNEIFALFPPIDLTDLRFELPTSLGLVGGVLSALGLVALVTHKQYGLGVLLAGALAILVFMLLEASFGVWLRIPLLAQLRSSTRFLSVGSLFIALAGGASLLLIRERFWNASLAVLLPLCILVVMPLTYANQKVVRWPDGITAQDEIEHELTAFVWGSTSYDEFDPIWGERTALDPPAEPEAYATDPMRIVVKELDIIKQSPELFIEQLGTATVKVRVATARPVRFRQYYFPGWSAKMDGVQVEVYPEDEFGLLTIDVPEGEHVIHLEYVGTPIQKIATGISVLTVGVIGTILFFTRRRSFPKPIYENNDSKVGSCHSLPTRFAGVVIVGAAGFALLNAVYITPNTLWFRHKSSVDTPNYMENSIGQTFGDTFELLGYTLEQETVAPGELLNVMLFWHPLREIEAEYRPVVQLVNLPVTAAWASNEPVLLGNNKTVGFTPDKFASDIHKLRIFEDAPPYVGRISVQLFDTSTGESLKLPDGADRVVLPPLIRLTGNGRSANKMFNYRLGDTVALDCATVRREQSDIKIDLYWHVINTPSEDLTVLVHGLDETGELVVQNDAPPLLEYPSSLWLAGQNLVSHLTLPADESVTNVAIGLYHDDTRLTVTANGTLEPDNRIVLPITANVCLP
jgi:hypothetical protein